MTTHYATDSSMEMLPRVRIDKGSSTTQQGHSEDHSEATADQPEKLGGSRPERMGLEEDKASIYETNRIATAKVKMVVRKTTVTGSTPRMPKPSQRPRSQRNFRA
ncbi:unnamed protein product [Schistocephalus solidus]|uniref:Uncharacterized protein n=1 Tax=Schistocephalus solidus TaxID=70667 RepID=A0A183SZE5_SCHSO|nr:unnamed protein product [Schistocephalus solidus]